MAHRLACETALHTIQQRIKDKVEFQTNYANVFTQIRHLTNQLNFYDRPNKPGCISLEDFQNYLLQRMNFISLNTEIEYLFYHYDEGMIGYIDYKDFINQLYESTENYLPILTVDAVNTLEKIRSAFLSNMKTEQHNFLMFLIRLRDRLNVDESGYCARLTVIDQLFSLIVTSGKSNASVLSKKDLSSLIKFFDLRKNDTVHVPTLLRYLKSVMSPYRKHLILEVYRMLDRDCYGFATVGDIKQCYHLLPNKTIKFRGKTFTRATLDEFLGYFFGPESRRVHNSRAVPWDTFYEYYQCISLCIDSDELFELVIRHSWQIPNATLDGKPMANEKEDVFERSMTSSFDTMTTKDKEEMFVAVSPMASRSFDFGLSKSFTSSRSNDTLPPINTRHSSIDVSSISSRSFDIFSPRSVKGLPATPASMRKTIAGTPKRVVSRPIVVVHSDYSEETIKINDELGKTKLDPESLCKELNAMGIFDIRYIKV